ncbi:MAG: hypothetical protein BWZ02_02448 [Lentisphaerae bacterium ADurb.BinA184]|nr:MAG: hypothetical protein BWZ02_02448 [Lentisphaerae bacterium ADurb.BinA184]
MRGEKGDPSPKAGTDPTRRDRSRKGGDRPQETGQPPPEGQTPEGGKNRAVRGRPRSGAPFTADCGAAAYGLRSDGIRNSCSIHAASASGPVCQTESRPTISWVSGAT